MGALHGAHLSLIEESKQQDDLTLCSIFVNPDQFDRKEDWMNYARFPEKDITFLESADCDTCFFVLCSGDLS
ncbi:pantoate--beta-alanine ligase [Bacteroidetes bacterium endosymbiont of Geopemphigus sp.]|nr:pantoate--beta-alanine ligase [Bacteroidetes bacterium endosymbiont of Geopemphigus sp.]